MKIKKHRKFVVFTAYRKPDADRYHQYRIDGKIVSWQKYVEKRTKLAVMGCWPCKSYTTFLKNGTIVDVNVVS